MASLAVAILVGVLQGLFEWLPVSSEGNVTLVLTALEFHPEVAVGFSLFLHLGTAVAATAYYRGEILGLVQKVPAWRPTGAFSEEHAELTFLGLATVVSGVVGIGAYALLMELATALSGGLFVAGIGALLVLTGVLQRTAAGVEFTERDVPGVLDAVLVGVGQGLAILPGVSRSGTTVSVLLLRGYDGETSFDLSFLLSIPAAIGGGVLALGESGAGLPSLPVALVALVCSALVGYLTIDALLRVVRRVAFWGICVGLGGLALVGGVLVVLA